MVSVAVFQEKTETNMLTNWSEVTQLLSRRARTQTQVASSAPQVWFSQDIFLIVLSEKEKETAQQKETQGRD